MAAKQVNLAKVFQSVAAALAENREVLNQADTYNHDHGDNVTEVFEVVTQAVKERKNASAAEQLAYASELLKRRQSGSARYYAGGLAQAAQQFQGKKVTSDNVMQLVQTLLSGGQEAPPAAAPDLLTSLLGGATGQATGGAQPGIDMASLLNAGMAYLSAKGSGQNDMQALMGALMTAAQGGNAPHRAQSGALIANTLLQAIGGAASRR